jgi:hypothetical protein
MNRLLVVLGCLAAAGCADKTNRGLPHSRAGAAPEPALEEQMHRRLVPEIFDANGRARAEAEDDRNRPY